MDTDKEWEKWGKRDPYYGVITDPKYRSAQLTPETKEEFFRSGEEHVASVLETVRKFVDPDFSVKSALDFGSGTGRITIALAKISEQAVGVDISDSMLSEAGKNALERGIENIAFLKSDDDLSHLGSAKFNFVHTFIVLQHIPVERVRPIFLQLLNRLEEGGVGVLHLTYGLQDFHRTYGMPPESIGTALRKHYRMVRAFIRSVVCPKKDPEMQMNRHILNHLFFLMQSAGIKSFHTEFTDHGGCLGVALYFQKPSSKVAESPLGARQAGAESNSTIR